MSAGAHGGSRTGEFSAAELRAARDELLAFAAAPAIPECPPVVGLPLLLLPGHLVMLMPDGSRRPINGFWFLEREPLEASLTRLAREFGAASVEIQG